MNPNNNNNNTLQGEYFRKQELMKPLQDTFDPNDQRVREDLIRVITQYLSDEGYHSSILTLMDEANMIWQEHEERSTEVKKMKRALLGG